MDFSHGKCEIWKSKDCKPASFQVSCHFVCGVLGLNPEKHMEGIHHLCVFWIWMIIDLPNSRYRNFSIWCHFVCPFCFQNKNTTPKDWYWKILPWLKPSTRIILGVPLCPEMAKNRSKRDTRIIYIIYYIIDIGWHGNSIKVPPTTFLFFQKTAE